MGRIPLLVKSIINFLLNYLLNCLAIYGVLYAPTILQSYRPTAALGDALASYYAWVGEKNNLWQGLTSLGAFGFGLMACWLARDAYVAKKTVRASPTPTPTPAKLEDGTAVTGGIDSHPAALEAQVASPAPPTPAAAAAGLLVLKAMVVLLYCGIFVFGISKAGIVSLQQPLLENIRVTVLYVVRGWRIIVGPAMLFVCLVWASPSRRAAAKAKAEAAKAAQAASVAVLPEGEKPYTDEEV